MSKSFKMSSFILIFTLFMVRMQTFFHSSLGQETNSIVESVIEYFTEYKIGDLVFKCYTINAVNGTECYVTQKTNFFLKCELLKENVSCQLELKN